MVHMGIDYDARKVPSTEGQVTGLSLLQSGPVWKSLEIKNLDLSIVNRGGWRPTHDDVGGGFFSGPSFVACVSNAANIEAGELWVDYDLEFKGFTPDLGAGYGLTCRPVSLSWIGSPDGETKIANPSEGLNTLGDGAGKTGWGFLASNEATLPAPLADTGGARFRTKFEPPDNFVYLVVAFDAVARPDWYENRNGISFFCSSDQAGGYQQLTREYILEDADGVWRAYFQGRLPPAGSDGYRNFCLGFTSQVASGVEYKPVTVDLFLSA
jgi:hypothetical protein